MRIVVELLYILLLPLHTQLLLPFRTKRARERERERERAKNIYGDVQKIESVELLQKLCLDDCCIL